MGLSRYEGVWEKKWKKGVSSRGVTQDMRASTSLQGSLGLRSQSQPAQISLVNLEMKEPRTDIKLTADPIDSSHVVALVRSPQCGAIATFEGVTRNHYQGVPLYWMLILNRQTSCAARI
jgi:hypothetical protein